ncbi:MAG: DUF1848 domain-containing protein [Oscillospiraceae bacterium]|jgi:hypothetical protein|nr:DUF1848 domain-containing protein [Oscillospiraceae bacterium]
MIISASRRTDIPAFYSEWFFNRLREGYALARNPINPRLVSKISLLPEDVDGIVFWTKNPLPLLDKIENFKDFQCAWQFTLTPYGRDIEPNVPDKNAVIIPAFLKISGIFGKERITWRYDPILINARYTFDYHVREFEKICKILKNYTNRVTISFVIEYKSIARNMRALNINKSREEQLQLAEILPKIAQSNGLEICACCDPELSHFGIIPAKCVDAELFGIDAKRDRNQRPGCNCAVSVDIGEYATCLHGCRYCYANHSAALVSKKYSAHDKNSPILVGELQADDIVKIRS